MIGRASSPARMLFDAIEKQDMNAFAKQLAVPLVLMQGSDGGRW